MIKVCDDCEYTILIADLIETLASLDEFILKIWITGTELPFTCDDRMDLDFLQEGIRFSNENVVLYIFYDTIATIKVVK